MQNEIGHAKVDSIYISKYINTFINTSTEMILIRQADVEPVELHLE